MTRRRSVLAATLGALWSLGACAAAPAGAPRPSTRPPRSAPPDAATLIEEIGNRFPDEYAGIVSTPNGIIVYRRGGAGFDDAVRAAAPGVDIRDAPHTRGELTALADRIRADTAYWTARGIPIWSVAARPDGTAVEVGTSAGDQLRTAARNRYGAGVPIVVLAMAAPPSAVPGT